MSRSFTRDGYPDGILRAPVAVWVHLTPNQVEVLERLAEPTGKALAAYLQGAAEAFIDQLVPAATPAAG